MVQQWFFTRSIPTCDQITRQVKPWWTSSTLVSGVLSESMQKHHNIGRLHGHLSEAVSADVSWGCNLSVLLVWGVQCFLRQSAGSVLQSALFLAGTANSILFIYLFIFISWRLLLYNIVVVFVIHWHESAMDLHVFPIPIPPSTSLSTRSFWVFPVHQARALVSCIQPGLVICFTLDIIHVSMLISRNIPSPSPTESKSLFCTSVSLFLFCIWGYRYHLSKFHIYALVCCNVLYLSRLLHSV